MDVGADVRFIRFNNVTTMLMEETSHTHSNAGGNASSGEGFRVYGVFRVGVARQTMAGRPPLGRGSFDQQARPLGRAGPLPRKERRLRQGSWLDRGCESHPPN